ncbi:MAG: hypothetical protein AB1750_15235 [Chloroflexota bacterium]
MKHHWIAMFILLVPALACNLVQSAPVTAPTQAPLPENGNRPPATASVPAEVPAAEIPPLYFFYAIHTHVQGDWLPYESPPMLRLDTRAADNMLLAITAIQQVLDRYGAKGTWEVVYGTAKGLCTYQGQNHIFRQLEAAGHEIAVHAHRTEDIGRAAENLRTDCGMNPQTTSGFIAEVSKAGTGGAQEAMIEAIEVSLANGLTVGTENLSPGGGKNPFAELCANQFGVGNDMWRESGNLMFPWRPDYPNGNICADNPQAQLVFVDHVSIEWLTLAGGGMPDVVGDAQFDALRQMFDAALAYMEQNRPQQVAAWGFVTHITEYAPGSKAENPPDPQVLAALDRFMAYVAQKAAEGRVIFATAGEIARSVVPMP